jgi:3-hydroxybutyryl-CoA dehydrogenase
MQIGIVGDGKMGADIFNYISGFYIPIVWVGLGLMDKQQSQFEKKLKRKLDNELITKDFFNFRISNTKFESSYTKLTNCDIIIECIWENLEAKQALIGQLETVIHENSIIASNSSSIVPSELTKRAIGNSHIIGLHFFYPVMLKNIVEVIYNRDTNGFIKGIISNFLSKIDRKPLYLNENNAFILNKYLLNLQTEVYNLMQDFQLSYRQMDNIIKEILLPAGIFETIDHIGIDVILPSVINYTAAMENSERQRYLPLIKCLENLYSKQHLGIKSDEGFYSYKNEGINKQQEIIDIKPELKETIDIRIKKLYVDSFNQIISNSFEEKELLNSAIKEFLDVSNGPLEMMDNKF